MTHDTDALVSEKLSSRLRSIAISKSAYHGWRVEDLTEFQAADAIDRLTRELGEALRERQIYADQAGELASVATDHGVRAETAEAALSAARAELAECRNKAHIPRGKLHYWDFNIEFYQPPIPDRRFDFRAAHKDYDGDGDTRHFQAGSLNEILQMIDDWHKEHDSAEAPHE